MVFICLQALLVIIIVYNHFQAEVRLTSSENLEHFITIDTKIEESRDRGSDKMLLVVKRFCFDILLALYVRAYILITVL